MELIEEVRSHLFCAPPPEDISEISLLSILAWPCIIKYKWSVGEADSITPLHNSLCFFPDLILLPVFLFDVFEWGLAVV